MKIKKIFLITISVIVSIVLILACVVYFLFVRLPVVQNRYIIDKNQIKTKIRETDGMVMVYIPASRIFPTKNLYLFNSSEKKNLLKNSTGG